MRPFSALMGAGAAPRSARSNSCISCDSRDGFAARPLNSRCPRCFHSDSVVSKSLTYIGTPLPAALADSHRPPSNEDRVLLSRTRRIVGASPLRRTAVFALQQQGQIRKGFTRTEALALRAD